MRVAQSDGPHTGPSHGRAIEAIKLNPNDTCSSYLAFSKAIQAVTFTPCTCRKRYTHTGAVRSPTTSLVFPPLQTPEIFIENLISLSLTEKSTSHLQ